MAIQGTRIRRLVCVIAICGAVLTAAPAIADEDLEELNLLADSVEDLEQTPGAEPVKKAPTWDFRLGVLAGLGPDYEGSSNYEFVAAPYFRIGWKDRIILRGRSLQANALRTPNLRLGPLARIRGKRKDDDNDALNGLGDVDTSVEVGGFLRYRRGPFRFRTLITQDVADGHGGALAEIGVGAQLPLGKPLTLVMVTTSLATDDYMKSYFGVNAAQSATSGLRTFKADGGVKDVGLSVSSRFPLSGKWSGLMVMRYWHLLGDAADSPIVKDKGEENQFLFAVGSVYRF